MHGRLRTFALIGIGLLIGIAVTAFAAAQLAPKLGDHSRVEITTYTKSARSYLTFQNQIGTNCRERTKTNSEETYVSCDWEDDGERVVIRYWHGTGNYYSPPIPIAPPPEQEEEPPTHFKLEGTGAANRERGVGVTLTQQGHWNVFIRMSRNEENRPPDPGLFRTVLSYLPDEDGNFIWAPDRHKIYNSSPYKKSSYETGCRPATFFIHEDDLERDHGKFLIHVWALDPAQWEMIFIPDRDWRELGRPCADNWPDLSFENDDEEEEE